jgi:PKD repeat protein
MNIAGWDGKGGRRALGPAAAISVALTMIVLGLLALTPVDAVEAETTSQPDLTVEALYNYTEVKAGEITWFNLTIKNLGDAAYLVRTSGDLEIYGYRDSDSQVVIFERVYDDIYVNATLVFDLQVQFNTLGPHSLTIVIDEANRVKESNEDNNEATHEFEVVKSQQNRAPKADGGNDRTGSIHQNLLFTAQYSSDPDGDEMSFFWDFGDGAVSTEMKAHHGYDELGDYRVELTVSDGELSDTDVFTVHIIQAPANEPPTAKITVAVTQVEVSKGITMDGSGSTDPDGDSLQFDWDFDETDGVDDWVRGPAVVISWEKVGTYIVTLRVSDGKANAMAKRGIQVTAPEIPNESPNADAGYDVVLSKGAQWTFHGSGADSDGDIASFEWDLDGDGVYDTYSETNGTVTHRFDRVGILTMWMRVTDNDGAVDQESIVVTVKSAEGGKGDAPGLSGFAIITIITISAMAARAGRNWEHWPLSRT